MAGTWNVISPDGTKSTRRNVSILQRNTTYIKTNMQFDHYWDASQTLDGHHRHVQTPIKDNDPTSLNTDMDGMYYMREKTDVEAPDIFQKPEPFHYTQGQGGDQHYLQLGFRAMASFDQTASSGSAVIDPRYLHNVSSITASSGIFYRIDFVNPMPSDQYIVFGSGIRFTATNSNLGLGLIERNKDFCRFLFFNTDTLAARVRVGTIAICGG